MIGFTRLIFLLMDKTMNGTGPPRKDEKHHYICHIKQQFYNQALHVAPFVMLSLSF